MSDIYEMTFEERTALPADYHRPVSDSLGKPHSWVCAVCWDDGIVTSWPCKPAIIGGAELADAIGLRCIR